MPTDRKREKLTSNNQAATDDSLTTNTNQPNRRFSADQPPGTPDTPINATTGCTTLPPHTVPTPEELPQDHQSVNDYPWTPEQEAAIRRNHQKVFGTPPEEKDPPAPSPMPQTEISLGAHERGVPTPPNFSENNFVDILFDGPPSRPEGPRFVEVEDSEGNSISIGEWLRPTSTKDRYWKLRIPDWRHLRDEDIALAAQTQALAAENERLQFRHTDNCQTIVDLRGANTSILRRMTELQDKNRQLAKERHALASALQISNETIQTAIEKIASLLRVIK